MAYFSNSSEGAVLDNQCSECHIGMQQDNPCPVLLVQMTYNYDQLEKGKRTKVSDVMDCLVDDNGICKMKLSVDQAISPYVEESTERNPDTARDMLNNL